jgi:tRNA(Ile)-lysidine synthase TilS/MesJ
MLIEQYGTGQAKGEGQFTAILNDIKRHGRGKKYDCIVGVSGGTDSSYLIYLAKEWGLRPLAVHYDNTWNSAIATMNIHRVLGGLNVDLYTHVVANKEADDIFRAFFLSGVAEIEAATDLGYAYLLRKVASRRAFLRRRRYYALRAKLFRWSVHSKHTSAIWQARY